ncbi:MAG: hypothetical protein Q8K86_11565 [Candidatus Nanopelagicaceae bacterium]|nr:hypothetical protein [Candidatus Nanopelagicaceae bacterium]
MSREADCLRCDKTEENPYFFNTAHPRNVLTFPWGRNQWDGPPYFIDLSAFKDVPFYIALCKNCISDLITSGFIKPHPLIICPLCKKKFADLHEDEGNDVKETGECHLGYGSTHDFDVHRFALPAGWYCFDCLDQLIDEGKTIFLRSFFDGDRNQVLPNLQMEFLSNEAYCTEAVIAEILDAEELLHMIENKESPFVSLKDVVDGMMERTLADGIHLENTYFLIDAPQELAPIVEQMLQLKASSQTFSMSEQISKAAFQNHRELLQKLRESGTSMRQWRKNLKETIRRVFLNNGDFHLRHTYGRCFSISHRDNICNLLIDQAIHVFVDEEEHCIISLNDHTRLSETIYELIERRLLEEVQVQADVTHLLKS